MLLRGSCFSSNRKSKILITIVLLGLLFASCIRKENVLGKNNGFNTNFVNRLCGPPHPLSSEFGKFIRKKYINQPSSSPYNLSSHAIQGFAYPSFYALGNFTKFLFDDAEPGFFVEAGALDGERESNSLYLEKYKKWNGLLVEPNIISFKRLISKNRKAWSSNTCFSKQLYPHKSALHSQHVSSGDKPSDTLYNLMVVAAGALFESPDINIYSLGYDAYQKVQCIPIQTLLTSLNVTRVHLFSLDVEGIEPFVLDNFPFDQIFVDVWYVEHRFRNASNINNFQVMGRPDMEFVQKQLDRGLELYSLFDVDYLFINKKSPFHQKLKEKWPRELEFHLEKVKDKLKS